MDPERLDQLQNLDPAVRREAIIALGRSKDLAALPELAKVYKNDPVPELRELARQAGRYIQQENRPAPEPPSPPPDFEPEPASDDTPTPVTPVATTPTPPPAITEADVRLFTTLVRFDPVYHGHFKCNRNKLTEMPALWGYARDLFQTPGFGDNTDFDQIKAHYYLVQRDINQSGVVPQGPDLSGWLTPHGRELL